MNINPRILASMAILIVTFFILTPKPALAQEKVFSTGFNHSRSMEGSWTALVTIRDCGTGTPLVTFPAMQTYAQGGTMQDSSADSNRSTGHGVWRHVARRRFEASFQFFNFANGVPQGTTRVFLTNTVDRNGESFTTDAAVEVYDLSGNKVGNACATSIANRFASELN